MPTSESFIPTQATKLALRAFRKAGGTLRTSAATRAGIHPRTLAALCKAGVLDRVSRGIYMLSDSTTSSNPDLVVVAHTAPTAVVCLVSALAFHGLTTQIPHAVELAIAPGARSPKLEHPPVRVYRFGGRSLTEGVERHKVDGVSIRIFSAPKTVADCFKFRNRIGTDVAIEALRTFLRGRTNSTTDLLRFADIDRVRTIMMPYIEAIL